MWAVGYVYPTFNRHSNNMQLLPVFAAEVAEPTEPRLVWAHSELGRFTAEQCDERPIFRGLQEGLHWLRRYLSEVDAPERVFKLR